MPTSAPPRNKWLEPQTLVGIMGLAMVAYGGFQTFQSDVSGRVGALEVRVAVLEAQGAERSQRIDRLAGAFERDKR